MNKGAVDGLGWNGVDSIDKQRTEFSNKCDDFGGTLRFIYGEILFLSLNQNPQPKT